MQERMFVDQILNELESVGISVIERKYQVTKDYRCDALMEVKHDGISFLVCLDVPFNAIHDERTSKLPFPHISIDTSTPISVHDYDPSKKVFDISISYNGLGILAHIQLIKEIPEYIHNTLRDWSVLDEVSQLSDSNQFGRKINPTYVKPAPFTKPQKPFPKLKPKKEPPPPANAKYQGDTPACVDAPPETPGLNFDHIAESIVNLVDEIAEETTKAKSTSSMPLMTIGLYGPWGAGKSTLIRALQCVFASKKYTTITVNPWKWDGKGDIHAYVFKHYRETLKKKFPFPMFLVSVRRIFKALGRLTWYAFALAMLVFAATALDNAGLFGKDGISKLPDALKWTNSTIGVWVGSSGMVVSAIILYFWKEIRKQADAVIDKQLFGHRPDALGAEGISTAYQDIAAGWRAVGKDVPPFVFFFDDLDRCSPERVTLFAETVHSLTAAGCITFISCDEAYIIAALNAKYEKVWKYHPDKDDFGRRFLEKIVQIPYRVPSVQEKHLTELGIAVPRQSLHVLNSPEATTHQVTENDPVLTDSNDDSRIEEQKKVEENILKSQIITLIDKTAELFNMSKSDIKELHDLIIEATKQTSTSVETNVNLIAAFVVADRYMPNWLDAYTGHSGNEPKDTPESEKLIALLEDYLGEDKALLLVLYDRVSMRLPNIMNWLLTGAVEPLRLNIRQIKALSNTINLHLRIGRILSEPEAKKLAAFIMADMHDPDWLDRLYHGLDLSGTEIGTFEVLNKRLHDVLGENKEDLLVLYGQLGRQPKQKSSFDPPPKSEKD